MPLYRLTPPGELVEADSVRDEGRTVALIGTALAGLPVRAGSRTAPGRGVARALVVLH